MRSASPSSSRPDNLAETLNPNRFARARKFAALSLLLGALTACTTNEQPAAQPDRVQDRQSTAELPESKKMSENKTPKKSENKPSDSSASPVPPDIMRKLVAAVADEAGVSTNEVVLERAERSTFSDGSLDCPQPNMAYNQVIVEGYWVVFHVGQEEYDMRVTNRGSFSPLPRLDQARTYPPRRHVIRQ